MRVYLQPPQPSRGLERIATALRRYAPAGVEILSFPRNADLTVIYAIGRRDAVQRQVRDIKRRGKQYAVIQVCLKSTMNPSVDGWADIWDEARVVWSYYNLAREWDRAGFDTDGGWKFPQHFYHAPLGVDTSVFYYRGWRPDTDYNDAFVVATSGQSRLQESVRECVLAARKVNKSVFHVGRRAEWYPDVTYSNGCSDDELAGYYSQCSFVSGLRRKEGFELPAAEGLLCGSRPILFDNEDWRWNYKDWGLYIHEGSRQEVVDQLVQLFKQGARPVTAHEREEAAHWFNWERIVGEFWGRCL